MMSGITLMAQIITSSTEMIAFMLNHKTILRPNDVITTRSIKVIALNVDTQGHTHQTLINVVIKTMLKRLFNITHFDLFSQE